MTAKIERLEVGAYAIPTDVPESDGTLAWRQTGLVVVHACAAGMRGVGYTYGNAAIAKVVAIQLADVVQGMDAMAVGAAQEAMRASVRNDGSRGVAAMAISAVDVALWDLKARLLGLPLYQLLGAVRSEIPVYGSGGFTSYTIDRLQEQLHGWVAEGIARVKMKVGREPGQDARRVRLAREAIGSVPQLFVDANGAYSRKQALAMAEIFSEQNVSWFEEPVSSDDLDGLRLLRDRAPAGMDITAGEYGYDPIYFRRMVASGAVDVLQPDGTRCGGVTGVLVAGALCQSFCLPLSAHCAPSLHAHVCCALPAARHIEYFHDHVRIEHLLFEGALTPSGGALRPDPEKPGLGLRFREDEARRFAV